MKELVSALGEVAQPLAGGGGDYDQLMERVGECRFVLLGEASHGTHEFYRERAEITRRLIKEKGFTSVAVEADWPDAYRINRFVRGIGTDKESIESLEGLNRFPTWMWRNTDVLDFIGWLRQHNDLLPAYEQKVGFYGLDLYSLHASVSAVLDYLDKVDPDAASRARYRYSCFDHFGEDTQAYGYEAGFGLSPSCEDEVFEQLGELQRRAAEYANRDGRVAEDEFFYAEQNARLVKDAEEYYRSMFRGRISSWNLRDTHMADTLSALVEHLDRRGRKNKVVVWAHNSHLGDARATQMGEADEINVGQLVRQRYGAEALLVGFTTYTGTVTAASEWGSSPEQKRVRPALPGSYEDLFHQVGLPAFLVLLGQGQSPPGLEESRLERAIGVIYLPQTERVSHYFYARLPDQFDAVLHFDHTRAVRPLERTAGWETGEVPETFPSAL